MSGKGARATMPRCVVLVFLKVDDDDGGVYVHVYVHVYVYVYVYVCGPLVAGLGT